MVVQLNINTKNLKRFPVPVRKRTGDKSVYMYGFPYFTCKLILKRHENFDFMYGQQLPQPDGSRFFAII